MILCSGLALLGPSSVLAAEGSGVYALSRVIVDIQLRISGPLLRYSRMRPAPAQTYNTTVMATKIVNPDGLDLVGILCSCERCVRDKSGRNVLMLPAMKCSVKMSGGTSDKSKYLVPVLLREMSGKGLRLIYESGGFLPLR